MNTLLGIFITSFLLSCGNLSIRTPAASSIKTDWSYQFKLSLNTQIDLFSIPTPVLEGVLSTQSSNLSYFIHVGGQKRDCKLFGDIRKQADRYNVFGKGYMTCEKLKSDTEEVIITYYYQGLSTPSVNEIQWFAEKFKDEFKESDISKFQFFSRLKRGEILKRDYKEFSQEYGEIQVLLMNPSKRNYIKRKFDSSHNILITDFSGKIASKHLKEKTNELGFQTQSKFSNKSPMQIYCRDEQESEFTSEFGAIEVKSNEGVKCYFNRPSSRKYAKRNMSGKINFKLYSIPIKETLARLEQHVSELKVKILNLVTRIDESNKDKIVQAIGRYLNFEDQGVVSRHQLKLERIHEKYQFQEVPYTRGGSTQVYSRYKVKAEKFAQTKTGKKIRISELEFKDIFTTEPFNLAQAIKAHFDIYSESDGQVVKDLILNLSEGSYRVGSIERALESIKLVEKEANQDQKTSIQIDLALRNILYCSVEDEVSKVAIYEMAESSEEFYFLVKNQKLTEIGLESLPENCH